MYVYVCGRVQIEKLLFLEDDFLLTPDFYETLQVGDMYCDDVYVCT